MLHGYITMNGHHNIKFTVNVFATSWLDGWRSRVLCFIRRVTLITISLLICGVIGHWLFPLPIIHFGWKILRQFSKCAKPRENVKLYRRLPVAFYTSDTLNKNVVKLDFLQACFLRFL